MKKTICTITVILLIISLLAFSGCGKKEPTLSNPNADKTTRAVYEYICSLTGNAFIMAQQESTWVDSPDYEINYIYEVTGKKPAMRGLDFMNDDFDGVVERAVQWWNMGGLVTVCWHCGADFSGEYNRCKNDEVSDWDKLFTPGTDENKLLIENIDHAGEALKKLQQAGVTVLWRPFHEFDGKWFWWGKGGSDNFKRLWRMMYEHFTYDLELNNLIWVLGYSHNGKDYHGKPSSWYPGDKYCDIVGADSYEVEQNGAEERLYKPIKRIVGSKKPIIMHECGKLPSVAQWQEVPWNLFMPWHTEYLINTNTKQELYNIYNSEFAITLDNLDLQGIIGSNTGKKQ